MEEKLPLFKNVTPMTLERQYQYNLSISRKIVVFFELFFAFVFGAIAWLLFDNKVFFLGIVIGGTIGLIIFPILYFPQLKKTIARLAKKSPLQDENNLCAYTIFDDTLEITCSRLGQQVSQASIRHENLLRAVQYKGFLFVYIGINQASIIDGSCMELGTFADLCAFFAAKLGKKYKLQKRLK